ncbi:thymidine kinase [Periweissella cryptocerci]|uniref:Thymidine kinase n=1 Tax=Periweissella cryptocerci TaxID=2506420 RepID=A0A4P6YVB2_9LACO|nr:thymidine kinase [Periweissella cryptocerci]QBO36718.1 thymidine kinase [Periweissella cryptocerci]
MAQLFFRYGAMNSGKTIEILKVAHNYEEQGKSVLIFTSGLDNRDGVGNVSSRIGMTRPATPIYDDTDVFEKVKELDTHASAILIDEAQFITRENVLQLTRVVDELHIPVMAFGLKNDFQNHLFEGSEALLIFADKIEELKTICWFCERKASYNLRVSEGHAVYEGEQVQIGGNESYYPVCREHYFHPLLDEVKR